VAAVSTDGADAAATLVVAALLVLLATGFFAGLVAAADLWLLVFVASPVAGAADAVTAAGGAADSDFWLVLFCFIRLPLQSMVK